MNFSIFDRSTTTTTTHVKECRTIKKKLKDMNHFNPSKFMQATPSLGYLNQLLARIIKNKRISLSFYHIVWMVVVVVVVVIELKNNLFREAFLSFFVC